MMKKYIITFAALSVFSGLASADTPTSDMTVIGTLTVPTCTVDAADQGIYDVGKVSPTLLSATAVTTLTAISKVWTVTCDANTFMNFTPTDNRAASVSNQGTNNFGLGEVNETGKIGYYTVMASNATVDGETSRLFTTNTTSFNAATTAQLTPGSKTGWSLTSANTQSSGKVFTVDLAVTPVLASTATMGGAITDDVDIDGSATLNFAYGI